MLPDERLVGGVNPHIDDVFAGHEQRRQGQGHGVPPHPAQHARRAGGRGIGEALVQEPRPPAVSTLTARSSPGMRSHSTTLTSTVALVPPLDTAWTTSIPV